MKDFDRLIQQKFSQNMTVRSDEGLLIIDSGYDTDMFNVLCVQGAITKEALHRSLAYFKGRPFAFWVGFEGEPEWLEEELKREGFKEAEREWAMTADLQDVPEGSVKPLETIDDFLAVLLAVVPDPAVEAFYRETVALPIKFFVSYEKGKPVATSSVFIEGPLAAIFDVIVLPERRGQGLGQEMTQKAMQYAKEAGCETAMLTATNEARYLYEKLGFSLLKPMKVYTRSE